MRRTEYVKEHNSQATRRTTRRPARDDVRGFRAGATPTISPLDRLPTPDLSQIKVSETATTTIAIRG